MRRAGELQPDPSSSGHDVLVAGATSNSRQDHPGDRRRRRRSHRDWSGGWGDAEAGLSCGGAGLLPLPAREKSGEEGEKVGPIRLRPEPCQFIPPTRATPAWCLAGSPAGRLFDVGSMLGWAGLGSRASPIRTFSFSIWRNNLYFTRPDFSVTKPFAARINLGSANTQVDSRTQFRFAILHRKEFYEMRYTLFGNIYIFGHQVPTNSCSLARCVIL